MLEKEKKLIIVGDPIEDVYATVQDGKTVDTCTLPGGALNTYMNAKQIFFETDLFFQIHFVPELKFTDKYVYKILRLNHQPDIHLCKTLNKKTYYSDVKYTTQRQLNLILDKANYYSVLVFSDYNKGVINLPIHKYKGIDKIFLAIVDSKYRSLDDSLFEYASNYIWRCTGSEYDETFARKFEYTIWTNGSKDIKLLNQKQQVLETFKVPSVQVVDTCGAGDTFTASFASYIFKYPSLEIKNIKKAILFSIQASLNVIQKSKTAITDIKI
jgi:hypothetical protein